MTVLRAVDCVHLTVSDLDAGLTTAGATLVIGPLDIPVGRVAILADPFGNHLSVLDLSKGRYTAGGEVVR